MKIGIFWGSSGFVGAELIKLFSKRKELDICHCKISRYEGCKSEDTAGDIEVAFLALPASQSMKLVPKLLDQKIKIIDLSGAYRLKTAADYQDWYGFRHVYPSLLGKAVYGLPEKNRQMIRASKFIANPGCYATAVSLGLLPLVENHIIDAEAKIVVEAVSGYTGGGKDVKIPGVVTPYKGGRQHQHIPEIEQELNIKGQLLFYPHIAPWPRGIELVIHAKMITEANLMALYKEVYGQEPFIQVCPEDIKRDDVIGTNFCNIYPSVDGSIAIINVAIDNLGKGAAGQAVQNFNLMCGFAEEEVY